MRIRSTLLLCSLLAGCGFRSGLDETSFTFESLVLDQSSYVQGELGEATATFRNAGPRPAALEDLSLTTSSDDGVDDFTETLLSAPEDLIAPGDLATVVFSFVSTETATPRTVDARLKSDDDGVLIASRPFTLQRAALLEVQALVFESPGVGEPQTFTCRGLERPALVAATVENVGVSAANLSAISLTVVDAGAFFESFADGPLDSIAPGETVVLHLELQALANAAPGDDYSVRFLSTYTDATTGHVRPEPTAGNAPLLVRVHVPAALELDTDEAAEMVSSATPTALGPFQIGYTNVGTVPARIDSESVVMEIADTDTSDEYSLDDPTAPFPITVQPQNGGELTHPALSLIAGTPTTGNTVATTTLNVTDTTCNRQFTVSTTESARGEWIVN